MARVAVIGCGPAGLLAAYAALQAGHAVTVLAQRVQRSRIGGAQYLHERIPGLHRDPNPDFEVHFEFRGTKPIYAKKVYGRKDAPCSWGKFGDRASAWRMDYAYDRLWHLFHDKVQQFNATPKTVDGLFANFDYVFSSAPAPSLCYQQHDFYSVEIWVASGWSAREVGFVPHGTVIYNGVHSDPWYRASNLTGEVQVETAVPVYARSISLEKPLRHECSCWVDRPFYGVGRYGAWKKGELVHHAYHETRKILSSGKMLHAM